MYQSDNSFHGSNQSSYVQSNYSPQFHHQLYSQQQQHHNVSIPSPQQFNSHAPAKTHSIRYGSNSELSKRSKNNQSYELSQDLIDKQIELLERKYGGSVRANRAALVIQRAWRRYMLNRKFASIRANVKVDKRNSAASHNSAKQRLSQSQSMEMQSNYQRSQSNSNSMTRDLNRLMASHDRKLDFDSSPLATPVRKISQKATPQHPYVNLLHQQPQPFNSISPYQLQYQNSMPMAIQSPDPMNQSWSVPQPVPHMPHFTAAQIYMRPKNVIPYNPQPSSAYSSINKKPPPEVPKRQGSTISNAGSLTSLKKPNGLSKSSESKHA